MAHPYTCIPGYNFLQLNASDGWIASKAPINNAMEIECPDSNKPEAWNPGSDRQQRFTVWMVVFVTILMQLATGLSVSCQPEISAGSQLFGNLILFGLMGYWLQRDCRKYRIAWVFDMGLFLYVAWPFIMPVYLYKTRGLKAIKIILAFLAIYFGAFFIGGIIGDLNRLY